MKKLLATSVAVAAMTAGLSTTAQAEIEGLSANAGIVSDYYYRGSNLGDAGAYAGVDYEIGGFYVGTWIIDDGGAGNDGLEYDIYTGWGMETDGGFGFSVGATAYEYTYTSQAQLEANLGLSFAGFAFDLAVGQDTDATLDSGQEGDADYFFTSVGWAGEIFGATVGYYDYDFEEVPGLGGAGDYDYFYAEVSAGGEVAGLDMAVTLGQKFEDSRNAQDDGYIVLDISKSFSF